MLLAAPSQTSEAFDSTLDIAGGLIRAAELANGNGDPSAPEGVLQRLSAVFGWFATTLRAAADEARRLLNPPVASVLAGIAFGCNGVLQLLLQPSAAAAAQAGAAAAGEAAAVGAMPLEAAALLAGAKACWEVSLIPHRCTAVFSTHGHIALALILCWLHSIFCPQPHLCWCKLRMELLGGALSSTLMMLCKCPYNCFSRYNQTLLLCWPAR